MFGTFRFNQKQFNVSVTLNEIPFVVNFSDALSARFGVGVEYHVDSMNFYDMLEQYSIAAAAIPEKYSLSETMQVESQGMIAFPIDANLCGNLNISPRVKANYSFSVDLVESLSHNANAGADIWFVAAFSDDLKQNAIAGTQIETGGIFSEMLTAQPDISRLEEEIALISVTVPPGSVLCIDSENYTVTLDGKNILHLQNGAWIVMDRSLYSISVDSGTGSDLSGEIVYTERYL